MASANDPSRREIADDNPLSSVSLRYSLRPAVTADGPGPHETRPFGLRFARSGPSAVRPAVRYCHRLQVAIDDAGRPLIESEEKEKPKEWESKTYSDGDEGQEEDCWGWEEQ